MAVTVTFWSNFSKKRNSTKQPSTSGTSINCKLKESTDVEEPVFILSGVDTSYNYCQAFGNYYFCRIVILTNDVMEAHCTLDVLATHKTSIGNTSAMILFDTAANTEIVDVRLGTKSTPTVAINEGEFMPTLLAYVSGSYVASVTGVLDTGSFVINKSEISKLLPDAQSQIQSLFPSFPATAESLEGIQNFIESLGDYIATSIMQIIGSGDLPNNIRDVRWMPFYIGGDEAAAPIYNGMYLTSASGSRITNRVVTDFSEISIPWQFSDWRNTEPYTEIYVYMPFIGIVSYPASRLKGISKLSFYSSVDKITGDLAVMVYADGKQIASYGASCGVPIPVGNSQLNLKSITNAVGSLLKGAFPSDLPGAVFNAVSATVGGIGSGAAHGLSAQAAIITVCHDTTDAPSDLSAVMGTPTYAVKTISSLSGYVQCQNASVEMAGTEEEKSQVNSYLNSGFYYE